MFHQSTINPFACTEMVQVFVLCLEKGKNTKKVHQKNKKIIVY